MDLPALAPKPALQTPPRDPALWSAAVDLEAAFLAEMLAHSGLGQTSDGFGGGAGEAQFASFLRQEQAQLMAARGGIGLAEVIFAALQEQPNAPD